MSPAPGWRRLLRLSVGRRSLEREVDDELAFHLDMRAEKLRRSGLSDDAAHTRAHERFGDTTRVRDELLTIDRKYEREVRTMEWIESVWSDLRFTLRTLRRMPAFTTVATLTLALGIGATAAMFTLVNGILLRPLPYPHADRLVRLIQSYPEKGLDTWGINQQNIALYRDRSTDFEAFSAFRGSSITIRGDRGPERLSILLVTSDFFKTVGVSPAIGRPFTASEDKPGLNNVIVLSYATWQTRFGGDPSILGTTLDVDGRPMKVIGVMPNGFAFPRPEVKAWLPMGLDPNRRFGYTNSGLGLLKPGVSLEHAERQTTAIMWDWARQSQTGTGRDPSQTRMKTIVRPMQEALTGRTTRPLTVLFGAVSLILLIAIANVATLLSSRAAGRSREISLRTALGATSGRLVRQLLTESVALALLGAVVGVALAVGGLRVFTHSTLANLPRIDEVGVDGRVLTFTLVISVASGMLFGLLPAIHASRSRLSSDLTAGQRESSHRGTRRINNGLVVVQLSLSLVLLIAAGLVLKSFERLTHLDLGFRVDGVTSISLPLPARVSSSALATTAFMNSTLAEVRAIPGVQAAALTASLPFEGNSNYDGYLIEGRAVPASGNEDQIYQTPVSPGYFSLVGIPLLYGRDFTAADDSASLPVAIVDETLAKRYWSGAAALGRRIRTTGDTTWFTIIGVAGAIRDGDATKDLEPHLYNSLPQTGGNPLSLAVRTPGDPSGVVPAVQRAVARIEPAIPLASVRTFSTIVDQSFATRRLTQLLLEGFALLAMVLAAIGIYGVMSLHVANRTREFGIRMAVGAEPSTLVRLVLREGAWLAAVGVVLGVVGALGATRWIQSLLYDVSATDPAIFISLPLLLAGTAIASCYLPARRAARSDPLAVLRSD
jgi:putative ABC transport system permease protein